MRGKRGRGRGKRKVEREKWQQRLIIATPVVVRHKWAETLSVP